jgi:hypothetical protein
LNEKPDAREELEKAIYPSSKIQYKRGTNWVLVLCGYGQTGSRGNGPG